MVIFDGDDEDDDDGHAEPDDQPRYEATTQPMQASNCSPELVICQCGLGRLAPARRPAPKQYGITPPAAAPEASTAYPQHSKRFMAVSDTLHGEMLQTTHLDVLLSTHRRFADTYLCLPACPPAPP